MRLEVISNYGAKVSTVSEATTADILDKSCGSIDWQGFHQLVLYADDGDFMELGGSLDPGDGLSVMLQEKGVQRLASPVPTTIEQGLRLMHAFLRHDGSHATLTQWT